MLHLRGVGIAGGGAALTYLFALRDTGSHACRISLLQASFTQGAQAPLGAASPRPRLLMDERTHGETRGGFLRPGQRVLVRFGYLIAPSYRGGDCHSEPAALAVVRVNAARFGVRINWIEVCTTRAASPWISWHAPWPAEPWPEDLAQPTPLA